MRKCRASFSMFHFPKWQWHKLWENWFLTQNCQEFSQSSTMFHIVWTLLLFAKLIVMVNESQTCFKIVFCRFVVGTAIDSKDISDCYWRKQTYMVHNYPSV
jgi:hypothetical protein